MKKKYSASSKDKKDWFAFTENLENVYNKEVDLVKQNITPNKIKKLDLHGLSLNQANRVTKKYIVESVIYDLSKPKVVSEFIKS